MPGINKEKGAKVRVILISEKMVKLLREHYRYEKPKLYLIERQMLGEKHNDQSLQQALKKTKNQGIDHFSLAATYSCDTPLGEQDRPSQHTGMLSDKTSKTTENYTHVSQKSLQRTKSLIDDL